MWSIWYLELRIGNKDKTRDQVLAKAINSFVSGDQKICRFIRGYSQFVKKNIKDYVIQEIDGSIE